MGLLSLVSKVRIVQTNGFSFNDNFDFFFRKERAMLDEFMANRPHTIDGRQTEPKRAMPRDEASKPEGQLTVKKIFIGGVKEDITEADLK